MGAKVKKATIERVIKSLIWDLVKSKYEYQKAHRKIQDQWKAGGSSLDTQEEYELQWDVTSYIATYDQARQALEYIKTGLLTEGKEIPKVLIDALHEDHWFL